MGNKRSKHLKDRLELAYRATHDQRGLITIEQLRAQKLQRYDIEDLVKLGELVPVLPRVWSLKSRVLIPIAKQQAGTLWLPDAVLSHRSAAALHGLPIKERSVELTRAAKTRRQKGYLVHRSEVPAHERVIVSGLPVTSVMRTLRDLAEELSELELDTAVDAGWRKGRIDPVRWLAQAKKRKLPLPRQLKRALRKCVGREKATQSALEARYLHYARKHHLPNPEPQVHLAMDRQWRLGDFAYASRKVLVETLGFERHGQREVWEDDQQRTLELSAAGWVVVAVTWRMLETEEKAAQTMEYIRQVLASRPIYRRKVIIEEPIYVDAELAAIAHRPREAGPDASFESPSG